MNFHTISKKTQTATEYLIIVAVVILIALIVVSLLGNIMPIGIGTEKQAVDAELLSAEIGVDAYVVNSTHTFLRVRNNRAESIQVLSLTVDGFECNSSNTYDSSLPFILRPGMSRDVNCNGDFNDHSGGTSAPLVGFRYQDTKTGATYSTKRYGEVTVVSIGGSFEGPEPLNYSSIEGD
jgi:hypothetical protein